MKSAASPIRFAGSQLCESRHVCAFFDNVDEEYRVLLPFIKDGLEYGDKAVLTCVYDLAKFGGETVIDIMRTHPMIVTGGSLQENPFFAPPEEFLSELRMRRAARTAPAAM